MKNRQVLPTRVGMVPADRITSAAAFGSPHPRGDGPDWRTSRYLPMMFSPPAWGWSSQPRPRGSPQSVLPTRVGMVLAVAAWIQPPHGSPHPRGDGPNSRTALNNS